MFRIYLYCLFFIGLGCTSVETINLKDHNFDERPKHIIWFVVDGLNEEHISLLKFDLQSKMIRTSFEESTCFGKLWAYNFLNLRQDPLAGIMTQITGNKNISNKCDSFNTQPIWNIYDRVGYKSAILEYDVDSKNSLAKANECKQTKFLSDTTLIRMTKPKQQSEKFFHYQKTNQLEPAQVLYDQTCQDNVCYASLSNNVNSLWKQLSSNENSLMIVRVGGFLKALKNKNISRAKEILFELEKIIKQFQSLNSDFKSLTLLTSTSSRLIEMPKRGLDWTEYQKRGKKILFKRNSLLSSAWATGLGAENFCGIYEESEVLNRFLWRPKDNIFIEKLKDGL